MYGANEVVPFQSLRINRRQSRHAEQVAEKGRIEGENEAHIPQGLKPDDDLIGFGGTTEVVP
jgi:hypothetical protein